MMCPDPWRRISGIAALVSEDRFGERTAETARAPGDEPNVILHTCLLCRISLPTRNAPSDRRRRRDDATAPSASRDQAYVRHGITNNETSVFVYNHCTVVLSTKRNCYCRIYRIAENRPCRCAN